jgi:O-succinylbenzoic acid--CoA ligase
VATSRRLAVDPARDHWLACLPLAHVGGLSVVTRALVTGTPLTVLRGFDADAVQRSEATLVSLVATALGRIDPGRFRVIVLGGAAPPADLPANAVTTYGMTETGSGVVYDGLPLDGVEVRIDDGGQILLRGPMLLRCYRSGENPKDGGGWFPTGDAGRIDRDGRLHVAGRMADLIITGGENVWPDPVEAALRTHPAVADVAVAGRPDPEWGERVVAFVVPATGAPVPALDGLRAAVKETLPAYCAPKELVLVEALPRTALGKIQKHLLPQWKTS